MTPQRHPKPPDKHHRSRPPMHWPPQMQPQQALPPPLVAVLSLPPKRIERPREPLARQIVLRRQRIAQRLRKPQIWQPAMLRLLRPVQQRQLRPKPVSRPRRQVTHQTVHLTRLIVLHLRPRAQLMHQEQFKRQLAPRPHWRTELLLLWAQGSSGLVRTIGTPRTHQRSAG